MMHRTRISLTLILLVVVLFAIVLAEAQGESNRQVRVAAAADLKLPLEEIGREFQKKTGSAVRASFGASGTLFAQISNGAPFDVFMSADLGYPQKLAEAGEASAETLRPYARGTLVLLMSKTWKERAATTVPTLQGLANPSIAHIAIANPVHAPYGRAADAALRKAGVLEQVRAKLVIAENISQAAQFVASGNADAGLVALTAVISDKDAAGRWRVVPSDLYPPIDQGAIVTRAGMQNPASRQFIEFLSTAEAKAILKRYGFAEVTPQTGKK